MQRRVFWKCKNFEWPPEFQTRRGRLAPATSGDYRSYRCLYQRETSMQPIVRWGSKRRPGIAGKDELTFWSFLFRTQSCMLAWLQTSMISNQNIYLHDLQLKWDRWVSNLTASLHTGWQINVQFHVRDAQTRNETSIKSRGIQTKNAQRRGIRARWHWNIGRTKMKFIHFITHKTYVTSADNQLMYIVSLSLKLPCIK